MIYTVKEGLTGVLDLRDSDGIETRYIPHYDFDEAISLLLEFQELTTSEGVKLKDAYWWEGVSWYPPMVARLYWHFFFLYIKFQPLVEKHFAGEADFMGSPPGPFIRFLNMLQNPCQRPTWKQRLLSTLVYVNNLLAAKKSQCQLLFFRFSFDDFRSVEILKTIEKLKITTLEIVPCPRIKIALKSLLAKGQYYLYGAAFGNPTINHTYNLDHLPDGKRRLFQAAILLIESIMGNLHQEYLRHLQLLRHTPIKTFYGFDDANDTTFPVLFAARKLGLKTVAHQHGAYNERYVEGMMYGISPADHPWYDTLIVWGPYWKEKLLQKKEAHRNREIIIGANRLIWNYDLPAPPSRVPSTILVPYEFQANTPEIGRFIEKFIACGYHVLFKPRKDAPIEAQLDTYQLSSETRARVEIVEILDHKTLMRIDIIAGVMTGLVYELLPYNKIIWHPDTGSKHHLLFDMVEEGLAHLIGLNDIVPLGQMAEQFLIPTHISLAEFFDPETLEETLRKHVMMPSI